MELLNATGMAAGYTLGLDPDGRERLVVAVKGTFTLPSEPDREPVLAQRQRPLVMADTFTGEPGRSAPRHEVDFAPYKSRCDVLLLGSAHAPEGRPARRVQVGLKVGPMTKTFAVVGERRWQGGPLSATPEQPAPFTVMAISYDRAFGGVDRLDPDPARHDAYLPNPVGRGWYRFPDSARIDGASMPNTEALGQPITQPSLPYSPMAFGPLGRNWEPRRRLAGSYDQHWLDEVCPFLPADFDPAYYQAAPPDQQMPYLQGGEEVVLLNLDSTGRRQFRLPVKEVPVVFFLSRGGRQEARAIIDTLVIEPEEGCFTLTWRANLSLKRNIFEVAQVLVGHKSRAWWRARELGKTYYASLADLDRQRRREVRGE
ncbi:MAG: DUF2169 domain-containing protein [Candidatus Competibacteraceae bacterium]|nr:DUF2169 domain-containing protein [Candidatus Competibacteraceae bacterium]